MKLRCHFNGGHCPYFTDGKVYNARLVSEFLVEVNDDKGNVRYVSVAPNAVCSHIISDPRDTKPMGKPYRRDWNSYAARFHECVGTWEVLPEPEVLNGATG